MAYGNSFRALDSNFSFLVVFVIGTTTIVLCRLLIPNPQIGTLFGAVAAVAVVGLLGWYSCRSQDNGEDISRAGDDLYYLGLLFTLVSLIYALIVLFIVNDRDAGLAERTYELIGSFGIALFSTVAGILGRVILHSMQNTARDGVLGNRRRGETTTLNRLRPGRSPESETFPVTLAQHDLDLLVRSLRAEIRGAADAFSHFNRMTMLQAQDTKRHAERIVTDFTAKLRDDAQTAIAQTEDVYAKLADRVEKTTDAVELRVGKTTSTLAAFVEKFGSTAKSFTDVSVSAERTQHAVEALGRSVIAVTANLDDKVTDVATACETLARNISEHQQIVDQDFEQKRATTARTEDMLGQLANRMEATTDTFERRIDAAARAFGTLVEQLGPASHSFSELPVKVEQIQRGIETLDDTLKRTIDAINQNCESAKIIGGQMDAEVAEWTRRAEQIRKTLGEVDEGASVLQALFQRLGSLNRSLIELNANIQRNQHSTGSPSDSTGTAVSQESDEGH